MSREARNWCALLLVVWLAPKATGGESSSWANGGLDLSLATDEAIIGFPVRITVEIRNPTAETLVFFRPWKYSRDGIDVCVTPITASGTTDDGNAPRTTCAKPIIFDIDANAIGAYIKPLLPGERLSFDLYLNRDVRFEPLIPISAAGSYKLSIELHSPNAVGSRVDRLPSGARIVETLTAARIIKFSTPPTGTTAKQLSQLRKALTRAAGEAWSEADFQAARYFACFPHRPAGELVASSYSGAAIAADPLLWQTLVLILEANSLEAACRIVWKALEGPP